MDHSSFARPRLFSFWVSAYLVYSNSTDKKKSRQFLLKRGIWLIVLEVTIVNFSVWFDIYFRIIMLQVIAANWFVGLFC